MKIAVRKEPSLYAPTLWWVTRDGRLMSIAEWGSVSEDEDITDYWTKEINHEASVDDEDMSGATEQEFGR
mgnify:CR=1 FL=1